MISVKRGTWIFLFVLGVLTAITCQFTNTLTYLHVISHVAILTAAHFALAFPPEELLDGLGLTLYDLFSIIYDQRNYSYIDYAAKRVLFFHVFVASYPALISGYFVHGQLFTTAINTRRFPELFDHPWLWLLVFVTSVIGLVTYYYKIREYTQWSAFQYFMDHPETLDGVETVINDPETFRIRLSQRTHVYVTRNFFIYSSNWRFVAVRIIDVRLQVDNTRMPMIMNIHDEEERLRAMFIKVNFNVPYLAPFTMTLRQDYYHQLNEILEIPIFVPPHITVPMTIMEELKEDFVHRIRNNSRHTHRVKRSEQDPCFACGSEENIIKISKSCTGEEQRLLFHDVVLNPTPNCENCTCRPLWCCGCIAQIFITRQKIDNVNRYEYHRGSGKCPTCRKTFCIRDVHFVDFDYIAEEEEAST
ncbi:Protein CBG17398 [Caenorhabditis briggsae]|uniref:Uncharacterized protein n=2 Tax=Caenorhabditis briggsae TaxID=6238 RepID=A0AAE9JQP1_CAEBR|nr:Protein CBG17398 [Caenorhabditis briggsae]UMM40276.1 hypothetical protein L5515_016965 [Caenorhabditis briggsae]CAP35066.1 Protein CBG17398 [Caenorhabditis briggsae]